MRGCWVSLFVVGQSFEKLKNRDLVAFPPSFAHKRSDTALRGSHIDADWSTGALDLNIEAAESTEITLHFITVVG